MRRENIQLAHQEGLHVRNSARIVSAAYRLNADFTLTCEGKSARADSVLQLMELNAASGSWIAVCTEGDEEDAAMAEIIQILQTT